MCPQFVLLGKSNNALFEFRFIFGLIGGYNFEEVKEEQYADHSSVEVLLFLYVCPKVVLLNESNVALFPFRLYLVAEVLLFLYVYPHVVSLDLSDDAPFAFLIIFVIQWETPLKQSNLGGAILTTLRHDCKNLTYT